METGLYLPGKSLTVLSPQARIRARAYTVGKDETETVRKRKSTVYPPIYYFWIGRGSESYSHPRDP